MKIFLLIVAAEVTAGPNCVLLGIKRADDTALQQRGEVEKWQKLLFTRVFTKLIKQAAQIDQSQTIKL